MIPFQESDVCIYERASVCDAINAGAPWQDPSIPWSDEAYDSQYAPYVTNWYLTWIEHLVAKYLIPLNSPALSVVADRIAGLFQRDIGQNRIAQ